MLTSFIGMLFFRHYAGSLISYPLLWYGSFFVIGLVGGWLVLSDNQKAKEDEKTAKYKAIEKLKSNAERIQLQFELCDFKSGSFSHEVKDPNLEAVEFIAPRGLRNLYNANIIENVIQSSLIYHHTSTENIENFYSPYFPFDEKTLEVYVINANLTLWVDRFDRSRYFFDLQK